MKRMPLGNHAHLDEIMELSKYHIVLHNVGNHTSCLSREGSWKNWLTLSFSLVSNLVSGFLATSEKNSQYSISDKVI